jgi:hypothetical protein
MRDQNQTLQTCSPVRFRLSEFLRPMPFDPPLLYVNRSNGSLYTSRQNGRCLYLRVDITGHTPGDLAGFTSWNTGAGLSWNRMEVPKTVILISAG